MGASPPGWLVLVSRFSRFSHLQTVPETWTVHQIPVLSVKMPLMSGSAAAGVSVSDEAAVKTRLLFDGDGTGEERRLNLLLKSVVKWCSVTDDDDSEESSANDVKRHAGLVAQLLHIEWTDAKSKLVQEMNEREANNYEHILEVIQTKLEEAEKDITEAKSELDQARLVRRNRMEYDSMAKTIQAFPSREDSGKNIDQVTEELERLKQEEEELDAKLQQRKKQFHVLVNSIHQLQDMLELEEQEEQELGEQEAVSGMNSTQSTNQTDLNTSNVSDENNMETSS